MYREEAVELMCETVNALNREMATKSNMPSEQIEQFIKQGQYQLKHVNGVLYDTLKENGVIN
jgi:transcriptional/translational regulatory protein YebC/TACO1